MSDWLNQAKVRKTRRFVYFKIVSLYFFCYQCHMQKPYFLFKISQFKIMTAICFDIYVCMYVIPNTRIILTFFWCNSMEIYYVSNLTQFCIKTGSKNVFTDLKTLHLIVFLFLISPYLTIFPPFLVPKILRSNWDHHLF